MSSPDAPDGFVAMAPPQDAAAPSSDAPAKEIRIGFENKNFTLFENLPKDVRDLVWDEVVQDCAQPGINFFQVYDCTDNEDRTQVVDHVRLDKNSKVAMLTRFKRTCKDLNKAVERYYLVASNKGERFVPITVSTHSGETRVLVNVNDIVSFASITDGEFHERAWRFPIKLGNIASPRAFLGHVARPPSNIGCRLGDVGQAGPHVHGEWNWIRRVAITYPLARKETEHVALAGHNVVKIRDPRSTVPCYPCIAWSLSGLPNLEDVFFLVKEVGQPRKKKNRLQSIGDSSHASEDGYCPCSPGRYEEVPADPEDLESDDEEGSASAEDEDTDLPQLERLVIGPVDQAIAEKKDGMLITRNSLEKSSADARVSLGSPLRVFYGAQQEYSQITSDRDGNVGAAHHSLKHFVIHFMTCANLRVQLSKEPRTNNVNFKLLSHKEK
ncbi:hypothetical protein VPNG_04141 [Cytospora leucostoma]|uniref:Uncharacterized protein n=1 Tax=Cytospora leucostoma TaxID=1230097 RepID=A0A423XDM3_9PEZI|nr:hypothetical protein VPNG_04141 [Cytospora leucostoma]